MGFGRVSLALGYSPVNHSHLLWVLRYTSYSLLDESQYQLVPVSPTSQTQLFRVIWLWIDMVAAVSVRRQSMDTLRTCRKNTNNIKSFDTPTRVIKTRCLFKSGGRYHTYLTSSTSFSSFSADGTSESLNSIGPDIRRISANIVFDL